MGKKHELIYRGSCIPLDDNNEKVVQDGNCLNFSDGTAKWLSVDGKFRYDLTIELED